MKRPIAISLSPNLTKSEIKVAQKLLFKNTRNTLKAKQKTAELLSTHTEGRKVTLTSSGRQALFDILRALNIRQGDEVIIQAFTCIAVPEPILWAGAVPIYADIKEDTYNLDLTDVKKKITPKTKAIIIQHTFGIPGPVQELAQLARDHNITLIEDCAHSLGASIGKKPVGTFSDVAFFSFGRDKVISSVYGGAIATTDTKLHQRLQAFQAARSLPPKKWVRQQLFHPVFFERILPWYFIAHIGKVMLMAAQKIGLLSKAVELNERKGRKPNHIAWQFSPKLALLAESQLQHLAENIQHRRKIAHMYQQAFTNNSAIKLPKTAEGDNSSWLRFPIQVTDPKKLLHTAKDLHVLLGDWYDGPLVPSDCSHKTFRYAPNSCPVAEKLAKTTINLPTYPLLTADQAQAVIELVTTYAS